MVITKSGIGLGLDMGMGDLGEPPVCEGFSNEVVLSRRGSQARSDATIAGAGAGGRQKAESFVSAGERIQSRQPRSSNVLRGSQQTDVLPAQVPQSERDDIQRISSTA